MPAFLSRTAAPIPAKPAPTIAIGNGVDRSIALQSYGLRSPSARCAKLAYGLRSPSARCAKLAYGLRSPSARCARLASAHRGDHLVREPLESILLYRERPRVATVEEPRNGPEMGDAD